MVLQQLRQRADYDHLASFSREDVLDRINLARLGQVCESHDGQLFFVLVAMQKVLK